MQRLSISLLGPFQATLDGRPLTGFDTSKTRALLAYLAVERSSPQARKVLAELLWPERPSGQALANLRHALANLRKTIGDTKASPPFLLIDRSTVQLNPTADITVDLAILEVHDERRRVAGQDVIALHRGGFLEGFALDDCPEFETWLVLQRELTSRRIMRTLAILVGDAVASNDLDQAIHWTEEQLAQDPWNEELYQQSMWLLAVSGQRSAALRQFEACRQMVADEYAAELLPATIEMGERIRSSDDPGQVMGRNGILLERASPAAPAGCRSSLPTMPGVFLGRTRELARIEAMLDDPDCPLITIVGIGGSGKTRLAIEAANRFGARFENGVCFVRLATVENSDLLAGAILRALDVPAAGALAPTFHLVRYLQSREVLLILDNFEQLVAAGPQLTTLSASAPNIKLLVTSRERLNLAAESLLPLDGLDLPKARFPASGEFTDAAMLPRPQRCLAEVGQFSGVQFFVHAIRRLQPDFELVAENEDVVVHLCRLLGGLPLAMELAATWMRVLSLPDIAVELERGIELLATTQRDVTERHRTMVAVFDHSWHLLPQQGKVVARRLAVFHGGCTREAAEAVTGATLVDLSALVDRSWLRLREDGRYEMHELVRQYCKAKLEETTEQDAVRQRHCDFFDDFMKRTQRELVFEAEISRTTDAEFGNMETAFRWAVQQGDMDAAIRVVMFLWTDVSHNARLRFGIQLFQSYIDQVNPILTEGRGGDQLVQSVGTLVTWLAIAIQSWYEQLGLREDAIKHLSAAQTSLERLDASEIRDELLTILTIPHTHLHYRCRGRYGEASVRYRQLLEQFDVASWDYTPFGHARGKAFWCGNMYVNLARCAEPLGRYNEVLDAYAAAFEIRAQVGDWIGQVGLARQFARLCLTLGDTLLAERLASTALLWCKHINDRDGVVKAALDHGTVQAALGRHPEARTQLQSSLDYGRRFGIFNTAMDSLVALAYLELAVDDPNQAASYAQEAIDTWSERPGAPTLRVAGARVAQGWAALAMGNPLAARGAFLQALRLEGRSLADAMDARLGLAEIAVGAGQQVRAVTLLTAVLYSSATANATRERAETVNQRLASPVMAPPEIVRQIETTRASARQLALQILAYKGESV